MRMQCKTIIIGPAGAPLCVPAAMWDELLARRGPHPFHAGRAVSAARALLTVTPGRAPRLAGLQCLRVFFDESGLAAKWLLSAVMLAPPCPLGPGAAPEPAFDKHSRDPLFWYPDRRELRAIAEALTAAWARSPGATPRPLPGVPVLAAPPPTAPLTQRLR